MKLWSNDRILILEKKMHSFAALSRYHEKLVTFVAMYCLDNLCGLFMTGTPVPRCDRFDQNIGTLMYTEQYLYKKQKNKRARA